MMHLKVIGKYKAMTGFKILSRTKKRKFPHQPVGQVPLLLLCLDLPLENHFLKDFYLTLKGRWYPDRKFISSSNSRSVLSLVRLGVYIRFLMPRKALICRSCFIPLQILDYTLRNKCTYLIYDILFEVLVSD